MHQPRQVPVVDDHVVCDTCPPRPVTTLDKVEVCEPDGVALAADVRALAHELSETDPSTAHRLRAALSSAGYAP